MPAIVTHCGHGMPPSRRQARGVAPKPRWLLLPERLYAQVVQSLRRRHLVAVQHRVVLGTKTEEDQV